MKAYLAHFRVTLLTLLAYRTAAIAGVLTQGFWGLLRASVFMALYAAVRDVEQPLSMRQTLDYVWLGQATFAILPIRLDMSVAAMMRSGTIAYELLRPLDLFGLWYARGIAQRLAPLLLRAPPLLIFAYLLPEPWALRPPAGPMAALLFMVALAASLLLVAAIAALMNVLIVMTLNGDGLAKLVAFSTWFGSGLLVPLPLLPTNVRIALEWFPFSGLQDTASRAYFGELTGNEALFFIARQLVWALSLATIGRLLLARVLGRIAVQGG